MLFFGWAGFHRFYVGKLSTGVLWFVTLGLFGMGWIFDVLMVLTKSFTDRSRLFVLPREREREPASQVDSDSDRESLGTKPNRSGIKLSQVLIVGIPLILLVAVLSVSVDSAFRSGERESTDAVTADEGVEQTADQQQGPDTSEDYVEGLGFVEVLDMYDAGFGRVVSEISISEVPSRAVLAEIAASVLYADRESGPRGGYAIHFYRAREAGISFSKPIVIAEDAVNGDWANAEIPETFDKNIITVRIRMRDPLLKPLLADHALIREWDLLNAELQDDEETHAEIAEQFEISPSKVQQIVLDYIEWSNSGSDYVQTFEGISLDESRAIARESSSEESEQLEGKIEADESLEECIIQGRMALVSADCIDPWPLTVDEGLVQCSDSGAITFWPSEGDGTIHQLNGQATQEGFEPIDSIWLDNPRVAGTKISLSQLLSVGRSLCP